VNEFPWEKENKLKKLAKIATDPVGSNGGEVEVGDVVGGGTGAKLVEDVVVPLVLVLENDPGLLQKVVRDGSASQHAGGVKVDLDELSETGTVLVADGLGISERLQDRVGLQNDLLKMAELGPWCSTQACEVPVGKERREEERKKKKKKKEKNIIF